VVEHELAQMLDVHILRQQAQARIPVGEELLGHGDRLGIDAVEHPEHDFPGPSRLERAEARRARERLYGVGLEPLTLEQRSQSLAKQPVLAHHHDSHRSSAGRVTRRRAAVPRCWESRASHSPPPARLLPRGRLALRSEQTPTPVGQTATYPCPRPRRLPRLDFQRGTVASSFDRCASSLRAVRSSNCRQTGTCSRPRRGGRALTPNGPSPSHFAHL
jgi:hypothetical protein